MILTLVVVAVLAQNTVKLKDEGVVTGLPTGVLNCVGAGISCAGPAVSGGTSTITVTGGGAVGYQTVNEEGTSLTQRTVVNFIGATITCVDNAGTSATDCTVSAGTGVNVGTSVATWGSGGTSTYDSAAVVVTATWVATSSSISITPKCSATVGTNTKENCLAASIVCGVTAISVGASFTYVCVAPYNAHGSYTVSYLGV